MRWFLCYWFVSCNGAVVSSVGAEESFRGLTVGDGEVFLAAFLLGADTSNQLLFAAKNSVRGVGAAVQEQQQLVTKSSLSNNKSADENDDNFQQGQQKNKGTLSRVEVRLDETSPTYQKATHLPRLPFSNVRPWVRAARPFRERRSSARNKAVERRHEEGLGTLRRRVLEARPLDQHLRLNRGATIPHAAVAASVMRWQRSKFAALGLNMEQADTARFGLRSGLGSFARVDFFFYDRLLT